MKASQNRLRAATVRVYVGVNAYGEPLRLFNAHEALKCAGIDGATVYTGHGLWKSVQETTTVIEVVVPEADADRVKRALVATLKGLHPQEAYLCTVTPCQSVLLS